MNRMINWIVQTEAGRRVEIQLLMNLVTSSLDLPGQRLLRVPSGQSLDIFAAFTAKHLASCSDEQRQRLHANALRLGRSLRRFLIHRDDESVTGLIFLLYRNIGIVMEGMFPEKVIVRSCFFCRHYSPGICSAASMMDSGVISGLMGGGKLEFSARLTEGAPCCICRLINQSK